MLLTAGLAYAFYGVFSRYMGNDFGPFFQAWSRGILIVIILTIFGIYVGAFKKIDKKDYKWFLLTALGASLAISPFYIATVNLPIGTALFLFYAFYTIFSFLIGKFSFNEKLTVNKLTSLILSLIGLFLLLQANIQIYKLFYILAAGISGSIFSLFTVLSKKISQKYSGIQISWFSFLILIVINFALSVLFNDKTNYMLFSTSWLANYGYAVAQVTAALLVIKGFKYIEAQKGSIILLSEVLFAVLLGFIFFKEIPNILSLLGGFIILCAMILQSLNYNFKVSKIKNIKRQ